MFDRFTDRAKKVMNLARQEAQRFNHLELTPEHILLGILKEGTGAATNILKNLAVNPLVAQATVEGQLKKISVTVPSSPLPFSKLAKQTLEAAIDEGKLLGHADLGTEHLLLGILRVRSVACTILNGLGVTSENARGELLEFLGQEETDEATQVSGQPTVDTKSKTPAIDAFCRDLSALAKENKLDPVIGREHETERVIQILSRRTKNNPVIIGDPGTGKAQPTDTPVLTPSGWVPIGDLKVNDEVMTPEGVPTKITGVYPQGKIPVYTIKFKDGRETQACGNHLWNVYANHKSRKVAGKTKHDYTWKVVTTETLLDRFKKRQNPKAKVQLTTKQPLWKDDALPIHPYVLGVLLGNGSFSQKGDTVQLTTSDSYISEKVSDLLRPCYKLSFSDSATNQFRIVRDEQKSIFGTKIQVLGLMGMDCYNKFIPDIYKNGSVETRQALVQGMMDTDGFVCTNGTLTYSTSSKQLAEDFIYVIRSLGGLADKSEKHPSYTYKGEKKRGAINYNVRFRIADQSSVVSLPRKVARLPKSYQYKDNLKLEITAIEKDENKESVCIKVADKNELYVTNDFIVTHNTAIIEGIALKILSKEVPENMLDKRVVSLDLALMLAGTKYRGQFEERLKSLVFEVRKAKNIVLFIDEIHTLVGAGGNEGGMDAANILKPALSRGEIQCVGATTLNEYRKSIEKDGALERRFQSVIVEPPSPENTVLILKGLQSRYEDHHNVSYTPEAIDEAVKLSDRYISARFFPDKAIDVIDEAGARTRIQGSYMPAEVIEQQKKIAELTKAKEEAVKQQEFEKAAEIRDQVAKLLESHSIIPKPVERRKVTEVEIRETVSKMTGVPLTRVGKTEIEQLINMEEVLGQAVVNQKEAISGLARAIRRSRSGLKDPNRPIGSFLFLGQSGVGKTYLTKQIAKIMFGSEEAVIPFDMSEYMEKHNASRLVGAPPGYVGYEEGGQLTEKVRRKPYSVILLDEVEKAHPDIFNLLLQVFEEGRLTDAFGRHVDFRNTIIVMTSNIGSELLLGSKGLGFSSADNITVSGKKKQVKETVLAEVAHYFRPEFLNRIDEQIVFNPLEQEDLLQIVTLQLTEVLTRAMEKGLHVSVADEVKDFLIKEGYAPEYGARPMRRAIEKYIEDSLAEYMLKNPNVTGSFTFNMVDGVPSISFEPVKKKAKVASK